MKLPSAILLAIVALTTQASPLEKRAPPQGIDVSSHQPNIDWAAVAASGVKFAYIKATESTSTIPILHFSILICNRS
jgi:GH25 family lysozyme M1 (1,4-beta-N-acetylmuramidase)